MGDPSLELQGAIRECLIASVAVTELVPASNILDRSTRPELDREILIGDGQTQLPDRFSRFYAATFAELHVWVKEDGLAEAKRIGSAIVDALGARSLTASGYSVSGVRVTATRYMRDPHGEYSHGVVSVRANVQEPAT
jgi:hypothetical protein